MFCKYFSELSNDIDQVQDKNAETVCEENDFDHTNYNFSELDKRISISEVQSAIKGLKRNKAAGSDYMINEYCF